MSDQRSEKLREVTGVPLQGDRLIEKGIKVVPPGKSTPPPSPPPGMGAVNSQNSAGTAATKPPAAQGERDGK